MSNTKSPKENLQSIHTFLRIRPLQDGEKRTNCLEVLNAKEIQANRTYQKKHSFDGIFGDDATQSTVYNIIVKPLIQDVLSGYNCTIFMYGQTGTGKTYTLLGTQLNDFSVDLEVNPGLIPRTVNQLFEHVRLLRDPYTVRCSYLEIHNEELHDLLSAATEKPVPLRIYDGQRGNGDVIIQGLENVTVHNESGVFRLLEMAHRKRGCDYSNRSHTIFSIVVDTRETSPVGEMLSKTAKLNFVHLAGSESVNKNTLVDRRINVNQSLFTLGQVINGLSEKNSFIPFRDSKLTRILRDSLGGKTKSIFIGTISFSTTMLEESLTTLDYISKARTIMNRPTINRRTSQKTLINEYVNEIEALKRDLEAVRSAAGVVIDEENYNELMASRQATDEQLAQVTTSITKLGKLSRQLEEEREVLRAEWVALNRSFDATRDQLAQAKAECDQFASEKQVNEYVALTYEKRVENLDKSARNLQERIKAGSINETILSEKIKYLYKVADINNKNRKMLSTKVQVICEDMVREYKEFLNSSSVCQLNEKVTIALKTYHERQTRFVEELRAYTTTVKNHTQNINNIPYEQMQLLLKKCEKLQECQLSNITHGIGNWQDSVSSEFTLVAEKELRPALQRNISFVENLGERISKIYSQLPFDTISHNMKTLRTELSDQSDQLSHNLSSQKQLSNSKLSSIARLRQEMIMDLTAKFDRLDMELTRDTGEDVNNIKSVESIEKIVGGIPTASEEFLADCNSLLKTVSAECIDTTVLDLHEVLDNYNVVTTELCKSKQANLSQMHSNFEKKTTKLVDETVVNLRQIGNELGTYIEALSKQKREHWPESCEAEACTLLNIEHQQTSDLINALMHKTHEIKTLTSHDSTQAIDPKPTGNTPLRNQIEVEHHLQELTPKETVRSRFRQLQKEPLTLAPDIPAKKLFVD